MNCPASKTFALLPTQLESDRSWAQVSEEKSWGFVVAGVVGVVLSGLIFIRCRKRNRLEHKTNQILLFE